MSGVKIAVCSGKGGTGKTTVATNLAAVAASGGRDVAYLDCDVEEPNGALFLRPTVQETRPVMVRVPQVDVELCNGCGKCGEICQFSAIVAMNKRVLVFQELCHGCGGCWLVCPTGAVTESRRQTGQVDTGQAGSLRFVAGLLNVGEAMSPPVIAAAKDAAGQAELTILDCPPGTSCPAIEAVRGSDLVLMVTEPTPFGLHDLRLAIEMARAMGLPQAVVINRADAGDGRTREYCRAEGIEVLAEIPDDRSVAEAYSRGELACEAISAYRDLFEALLLKVESLARGLAASAGRCGGPGGSGSRW